MAFYTQKVKFDDLDTVLRLNKTKGLSLEAVLKNFFSEEIRQQIKESFAGLPPFTVAEALRLSNAEQRMAALGCFSPEAVAQQMAAELKAVLVDKKTVQKKQVRWDAQLKPYQYVFEDTYELYKISGEALNLPNAWYERPDVYYVKCQCPSTKRIYYIYVPMEVGQQKDALAAIAWTMRFDNQALTKEQYLHLMYAET
ncbi:MAG: hypothetical protein HC913_22230 [Microscillaceae bacterium]|nr:hypothetical protein [Microscillaceae bacterium]